MTNLERVGVSGSLDSLDLAEILPIRYDQDNLTGERTWRDGYKDGQPLVTEREFPAIYFEGRTFPDKSPVGWIAGKNLRRLDVATAASHLVPQIHMVRKFLKERAAKAPSNGDEPMGIVILLTHSVSSGWPVPARSFYSPKSR